MHLCRDRADAMRCVFVVSSSGMGATSQSPRCRYPPLTMPSTWHSGPGRAANQVATRGPWEWSPLKGEPSLDRVSG